MRHFRQIRPKRYLIKGSLTAIAKAQWAFIMRGHLHWWPFDSLECRKLVFYERSQCTAGNEQQATA